LALGKQCLFREETEALSRAVSLEPFRGILYRHRGHRFLSCWRFEDACADFTMASRLIPGNWDVWYHLGLSHYLLGEYEKAAKAYKQCCEMSETEDKRIAVVDWYWMTLNRLGRKDEADKLLDSITEGMDAADNTSYYNRLLMYKGLIKPEELLPELGTPDENIQLITMGYGLSNYYEHIGDRKKSDEIIERILEVGDRDWYQAFGYLAAMTDKRSRENDR
jgi:tetratricopeptide (TPR) repeat protein